MANERSVWKGLFAGAFAGLAASVALAVFQELVAMGQRAGQNYDPAAGEDVTEATARRLSETAGVKLEGDGKEAAGRALHYGFGITAGALYGALAEVAPVVTGGFGAAYGTVMWGLTDLWALPKLGLAEDPQETTPVGHGLHWSAHVVYSTALEAGRVALRNELD